MNNTDQLIDIIDQAESIHNPNLLTETDEDAFDAKFDATESYPEMDNKSLSKIEEKTDESKTSHFYAGNNMNSDLKEVQDDQSV